jgi:DNA-binding transcriptional LysR family regulator
MSSVLDGLSWDDLRIIRAIGESGGLAGAATAVGVNSTTIYRRLSRLEHNLGSALFDRRRAGYQPTASGAELIALAKRVEVDIVSVAKRVSDHAQGHAGELLITTSDALLLDFVTPIIADFKAANPAIRFEVIVKNSLLNLARGESDLAIRAATTAPPDNLFGRKVATIAWAAYGRSSDFPGPALNPDELFQRQWASYGSGLASLKSCKFVEDRVPTQKIAYRSNSVAGMVAAIVAGLGVGFLPCMHGDICDKLVRIGPVEPSLSDELWILTHPDIRRSGRVSAFMAHFTAAIAKQRALIEGNAQ